MSDEESWEEEAIEEDTAAQEPATAAENTEEPEPEVYRPPPPQPSAVSGSRPNPAPPAASRSQAARNNLPTGTRGQGTQSATRSNVQPRSTPAQQTRANTARPAPSRTAAENVRQSRSQARGDGARRTRAGTTDNPRSRMPYYAKGPGPAAYSLPPLLGRVHHAPTHKVMPGIPLGLKVLKDPPRYGPGPGKYLIEYGRKANGMYDYGLKYTMRPKVDTKLKEKSPGPAAYLPKGVDLLRNKPPQWSLRIRPPCFNKANFPAPNAYKLPPMLGPKVITRPARLECSIKGDRLSKLYVRSPGPVYDIGKVELVKNQAPAYTLRPKLIDIFKNFGPGAGAYGLDKIIYPKRPAWPFGIKHTDFAGILKNKCDTMMTVPCENPCGY